MCLNSPIRILTFARREFTEHYHASEWSPKEIRKKLKLGAATTGSVSANIFFKDAVSADELSAAADNAIKQAAKRLGRAAPDVTIGRIHRSVRSRAMPN